MKILYAITRSEWGGAQAHLFELIKDQNNRGNNVTVIVGDHGDFAIRVQKLAGVKLFIQTSLVRELNPIKDIVAIRDFRKLIKKVNPDIIHLHSSKAGAIGRIAAKGLNKKVIFTAHGWAFTEGINSVKRFLYIRIERFLARLCDKIICVSKYDYKLALKEKVSNKEQMRVIYNGVEDPHYKRSFSTEKKQINIVMTARFDTPKNQPLLVEAFSKLPAEKYSLTLIGDGPKMEVSKDLVQKLELKNVEFVGFQEDITPFLKKADIFALISNYEGLPISIIEAMSYSLPIIASNVGGISELVDSTNGWLLNNNFLSLNFLENISFQSYMDISKESKEKYLVNFKLENILSKINNIYLNLCVERRK